MTTQKRLRELFDGFGAFVEHEDGPLKFVDGVFEDAFPATARTSTGALAEWQKQFGIQPSGTVVTQRLALDAEWKAQGGQSPRYLQDTLQAAGFNIFVHEWWDPNAAPFEQVQCGQSAAQCGKVLARCAAGLIQRKVRNPFDYAEQPLIGTTQCGQSESQCGRAGELCSDFLANDTHYIVNKDLTPRAPPRIPTDPTYWHYFLYFGGETFPDLADISVGRREELDRLILKLRPTQQWCVVLADYVIIDTFDETFDLSFD